MEADQESIKGFDGKARRIVPTRNSQMKVGGYY
jgi:hypothetical protein